MSGEVELPIILRLPKEWFEKGELKDFIEGRRDYAECAIFETANEGCLLKLERKGNKVYASVAYYDCFGRMLTITG